MSIFLIFEISFNTQNNVVRPKTLKKLNAICRCKFETTDRFPIECAHKGWSLMNGCWGQSTVALLRVRLLILLSTSLSRNKLYVWVWNFIYHICDTIWNKLLKGKHFRTSKLCGKGNVFEVQNFNNIQIWWVTLFKWMFQHTPLSDR